MVWFLVFLVLITKYVVKSNCNTKDEWSEMPTYTCEFILIKGIKGKILNDFATV